MAIDRANPFDDSDMLEIEPTSAINPLEDGGVEIMLVEEGEEYPDALLDFNANLAEHMDDDERNLLAGELMALVDADIASRKDWVATYVEGLTILGLNYEERTEPWEGACGVNSTLLAEAVIRFQAGRR